MKIKSSKTFSELSGKKVPGLKKISSIFNPHFKAKNRKAAATNLNLADFVLLKARIAIIINATERKNTMNFVTMSKLAARALKKRNG